MAAAALRRRILLDDLFSGLEEPATLALAQKVVPKYDERFNIQNRIGPSKVEIELIDGTSLSKELQVAYGHPKNPLSWQDLTEKFRECTACSQTPLSEENTDRIIEMVSRLEEIDDISRVVRLFT
jgi:2-methylcitrate dehydratase